MIRLIKNSYRSLAKHINNNIYAYVYGLIVLGLIVFIIVGTVKLGLN